MNGKRKPRQPWLHRLIGLFVTDLRETWLRLHVTGNSFGGGYRQDVHVTPAVIWTPWQKSILATIEELGITTHSTSLGVEFWTWRVIIRFGISRQKGGA